MTVSTELQLEIAIKRKTAYRKIWWRIIPFLFICYGVAFIDRINLGFTKLQMSEELGINATWFGIAAGAFFITYALCEMPSNALLARWGARRTFLRIMFLWGLATVATAFVTSVSHLITLRLLLGAFEAGFLPGIILYLTFWFPSSMRARVTAVIFVANAVAGSIASPLSGWIITYMDGVGGLSGWKWVFVVEGAPACLLGILCFFVLRDRPDDATWLTDDEKRLVKEDLAKDEIPEEQHSKGVMRNILCNPVNYLVAYLFFTAACSNYLLFFWLPTIVKDSGVNSLVDVGFLSAIPLLFGFVGAIALSWSSDVLRERRWHLVFCFGLISFGLVAGTIAQTLPWMLFFFTVASFGTGASGPLIWSLPPGYLDRKSAPLGIAFISTLGNVAGFVSPPVLGYIKTVTGSLNLGIIGIAMLGLTGAVLTLFALSPAVVTVKKSIDSPSAV
ncbi:D-galactonate transporter [Pseudomonas asturiensis]|uniref:D-galactonate transporter n=1 Tax=Pseudomonas asturiensis TaxID=1190415 RepID=A0A1M7KGA8_9PSED|nr:MFS transporter [Pseudomonas asturiensis]SHM64379.1 D-galactonate transporter [Pseudomonas asturiensis]